MSDDYVNNPWKIAGPKPKGSKQNDKKTKMEVLNSIWKKNENVKRKTSSPLPRAPHTQQERPKRKFSTPGIGIVKLPCKPGSPITRHPWGNNNRSTTAASVINNNISNGPLPNQIKNNVNVNVNNNNKVISNNKIINNNNVNVNNNVVSSPSSSNSFMVNTNMNGGKQMPMQMKHGSPVIIGTPTSPPVNRSLPPPRTVSAPPQRRLLRAPAKPMSMKMLPPENKTGNGSMSRPPQQASANKILPTSKPPSSMVVVNTNNNNNVVQNNSAAMNENSHNISSEVISSVLSSTDASDNPPGISKLLKDENDPIVHNKSPNHQNRFHKPTFGGTASPNMNAKNVVMNVPPPPPPPVGNPNSNTSHNTTNNHQVNMPNAPNNLSHNVVTSVSNNNGINNRFFPGKNNAAVMMNNHPLQQQHQQQLQQQQQQHQQQMQHQQPMQPMHPMQPMQPMHNNFRKPNNVPGPNHFNNNNMNRNYRNNPNNGFYPVNNNMNGNVVVNMNQNNKFGNRNNIRPMVQNFNKNQMNPNNNNNNPKIIKRSENLNWRAANPSANLNQKNINNNNNNNPGGPTAPGNNNNMNRNNMQAQQQQQSQSKNNNGGFNNNINGHNLNNIKTNHTNNNNNMMMNNNNNLNQKGNMMMNPNMNNNNNRNHMNNNNNNNNNGMFMPQQQQQQQQQMMNNNNNNFRRNMNNSNNNNQMSPAGRHGFMPNNNGRMNFINNQIPGRQPSMQNNNVIRGAAPVNRNFNNKTGPIMGPNGTVIPPPPPPLPSNNNNNKNIGGPNKNLMNNNMVQNNMNHHMHGNNGMPNMSPGNRNPMMLNPQQQQQQQQHMNNNNNNGNGGPPGMVMQPNQVMNQHRPQMQHMNNMKGSPKVMNNMPPGQPMFSNGRYVMMKPGSQFGQVGMVNHGQMPMYMAPPVGPNGNNVPQKIVMPNKGVMQQPLPPNSNSAPIPSPSSNVTSHARNMHNVQMPLSGPHHPPIFVPSQNQQPGAGVMANGKHPQNMKTNPIPNPNVVGNPHANMKTNPNAVMPPQGPMNPPPPMSMQMFPHQYHHGMMMGPHGHPTNPNPAHLGAQGHHFMNMRPVQMPNANVGNLISKPLDMSSLDLKNIKEFKPASLTATEKKPAFDKKENASSIPVQKSWPNTQGLDKNGKNPQMIYIMQGSTLEMEWDQNYECTTNRYVFESTTKANGDYPIKDKDQKSLKNEENSESKEEKTKEKAKDDDILEFHIKRTNRYDIKRIKHSDKIDISLKKIELTDADFLITGKV